MSDISLSPMNHCVPNPHDEAPDPTWVPPPVGLAPESSCVDEALRALGTCGGMLLDAPSSDGASLLMKAVACAGSLMTLEECLDKP
jgi:hypothetical protein